MGVALPRKENGPTVVSTKAFLILVDIDLILFAVKYDCEQYVKRTGECRECQRIHWKAQHKHQCIDANGA